MIGAPRVPDLSGRRFLKARNIIALSTVVLLVTVAATAGVWWYKREHQPIASLPYGFLAATFPKLPSTSWVVTPNDAGGSSFEDPTFPIGGDSSIGSIDGGDVLIVRVADAPNGHDIIGIDRVTGAIRWTSGATDAQSDGCSQVLFHDRIACLSAAPSGSGERFSFIRVSDGTVISETVQPRPYQGVTQAGDTLVYSGRDKDGHVIMAGGTETEPESKWNYTGPISDGTRPFRASDGDISVFEDLSVRGGDIHAFNSAGQQLIPDGVSGEASLLPTGDLAVFDDVAKKTTVVSSSGVPRFTLDGYLNVPAIYIAGDARTIGFNNGVAVDLISGNKLWTLSQSADDGISLPEVALIGDTVLLQRGSHLSAVDAVTGSFLWTTDTDFRSYVLMTDGVNIIGYSDTMGITALRLSDGEMAWSNFEGTSSADGKDAFGLAGNIIFSSASYIKGYAPTGGASMRPKSRTHSDSEAPPTTSFLSPGPTPASSSPQGSCLNGITITPVAFGGGSVVNLRVQSPC